MDPITLTFGAKLIFSTLTTGAGVAQVIEGVQEVKSRNNNNKTTKNNNGSSLHKVSNY